MKLVREKRKRILGGSPYRPRSDVRQEGLPQNKDRAQARKTSMATGQSPSRRKGRFPRTLLATVTGPHTKKKEPNPTSYHAPESTDYTRRHGVSGWGRDFTRDKEPSHQRRRPKRCRFHPWQGRSPREGNGNPLQYLCLGNAMDRGAWWAMVRRVAESTQLKQLST